MYREWSGLAWREEFFKELVVEGQEERRLWYVRWRDGGSKG